MLSDHMIGATVQSTSRIQETGAQAVYLNRKSRWNWGAVVEHLPYVTGGFAQGLAIVDGQEAIVQQTLRVTQLNSGASAHRAVSVQPRAARSSSPAGVRRIGFDAEVETQLFSPITGELFDERREELPRPDATQPWRGHRGARLRLVDLRRHQPAGRPALSVRVLADGRHADVRRRARGLPPLLHAGAAVHLCGARHCTTAATAPTREDPRLPPLFIGYQGLVRGYDFGSFDANECDSIDLQTCEAFDRLNGSRVAVASAELRFPLLGLFSRKSFYGPFPIEMALFADAGLAWTSDTKPSFAGGDRDWVAQRRRGAARQRAGLRGRGIRLRPPARSHREGDGFGSSD